MLINTEMVKRDGQELRIIGYTFNEREWVALGEVMALSGINLSYSSLGPDEFGREGRRHYARTTEQIASLERVLQGRFDNEGRFVATAGAGKRYACREVKHTGMGNGCEEFNAQSDSVATVKCGIIAGQQNWFGGDPKEGSCAEYTSRAR